MAYTSQSISNYNSNPPSDDGATDSTNQLSWQKHLDKLGNPLKSFAEAINTANVNAWADLANPATSLVNGFHLVAYPEIATETTANIESPEYHWNNVLRYIPSSLHASIRDGTNTTDLTTYIQNHLDEHMETVFEEGSYRISTATLTPQSGSSVRGSGKNATIIENDTNTYAFTYTNLLFCKLSDLEIKAIGTDGADLGILVQQSGTGNSFANEFRNIRFNGNTRSAFATTTQVGIYFKEAASGFTNYFHLVENCNFTNLNTCILADWNANASFIDNCQFQNLWYGIKGGMQEWQGTNLWWHSTSGSGSDYATFIFLEGKSASNKAQYNRFEFTAEPGATLTRVYNFDANAQTNYIRGHWQYAQEGVDSGDYNHKDNIIARTLTLNDYRINNLLALNDEDSNTADEHNLALFGDGTTSQAGTGQQKLKVFGTGATTRNLEIYQTTSDAYVQCDVAGKLQLRGSGSGSGVIAGDGAWNGEPLQLGSYYLWVDATGDLRIKSSAPTSDTDGTVVGTQT